MKEGSGRRKYDKQFKEEAVRMVKDGGRSVAEAARRLGIHEDILHKWRRQYHEDPGGSFPGKRHLKPGDEEMPSSERKRRSEGGERNPKKSAGHLPLQSAYCWSKHPK